LTEGYFPRKHSIDWRQGRANRHGTDHDSKPLPSLPGFYLPARQCRQEEHRSSRSTAQGFDRGLLALSFSGRFEFIPLWGFFFFLLYAVRRVDCRRCGAISHRD